MDFQRARSDEQRNERRRSILDTASAMLGETPVAEVSLNELSRRVGLAKSNVLRYFESREAILLDLLDAELADWAEEIDGRLDHVDGTAPQRARSVATVLAESMGRRRVMCDLIAAQTAVLERNISTEVALRHKRDVGAVAARLCSAVRGVLPELGENGAYEVVSITLLMASACWPQSNPTPAILAAYASDPEVAATQRSFVDGVGPAVYLAIRGLQADDGSAGTPAGLNGP